MKALAKILFGIFCVVTSLCILFSVLVVGGESPELFVFSFTAAGVFIVLGMYHGISGFSRAMREKE